MKSKYADKFFIETLSKNGQFACKYYNRIGIMYYLEEISNKIEKGEVGFSYVIKWLLFSAKDNYRNVEELINCPKIVEPLSSPELTKAVNHLEEHKKIYRDYAGLDLKNSLLYETQLEKYKELQQG